MAPTSPRPDSPGPPAPAAELIVLSVLADGPLYGYAIAKHAAARSEGDVRLSPGVLYPLLKALERDGLITSSWETIRSERSLAAEPAQGADPEAGGAATGGGGGRRRKWYRLSPKGRRRLTQHMAAHRAFVAMIEKFLRGGAAAGGAEPHAEEPAP